MSQVYKKKNNVRLSDEELEFLKVVNHLGPCSSQKVYEFLEERFDLLIVMRSMHALVEKGFLQRIIINKTQLYKTTRNYAYVEGYLDNQL